MKVDKNIEVKYSGYYITKIISKFKGEFSRSDIIDKIKEEDLQSTVCFGSIAYVLDNLKKEGEIKNTSRGKFIKVSKTTKKAKTKTKKTS